LTPLQNGQRKVWRFPGCFYDKKTISPFLWPEQAMDLSVLIRSRRSGGTEWTDARLGLSDWELERFIFACCLLRSARRDRSTMPAQIATASSVFLFAALLMLSSQGFVDSRASNVNLVVSASKTQ